MHFLAHGQEPARSRGFHSLDCTAAAEPEPWPEPTSLGSLSSSQSVKSSLSVLEATPSLTAMSARSGASASISEASALGARSVLRRLHVCLLAAIGVIARLARGTTVVWMARGINDLLAMATVYFLAFLASLRQMSALNTVCWAPP